MPVTSDGDAPPARRRPAAGARPGRAGRRRARPAVGRARAGRRRGRRRSPVRGERPRRRRPAAARTRRAQRPPEVAAERPRLLREADGREPRERAVADVADRPEHEGPAEDAAGHARGDPRVLGDLRGHGGDADEDEPEPVNDAPSTTEPGAGSPGRAGRGRGGRRRRRPSADHDDRRGERRVAPDRHRPDQLEPPAVLLGAGQAHDHEQRHQADDHQRRTATIWKATCPPIVFSATGGPLKAMAAGLSCGGGGRLVEVGLGRVEPLGARRGHQRPARRSTASHTAMRDAVATQAKRASAAGAGEPCTGARTSRGSSSPYWRRNSSSSVGGLADQAAQPGPRHAARRRRAARARRRARPWPSTLQRRAHRPSRRGRRPASPSRR